MYQQRRHLSSDGFDKVERNWFPKCYVEQVLLNVGVMFVVVVIGGSTENCPTDLTEFSVWNLCCAILRLESLLRYSIYTVDCNLSIIRISRGDIRNCA
jgi:hypothetical protein